MNKLALFVRRIWRIKFYWSGSAEEKQTKWCVWDLVTQSRSAESKTSTKTMFRKTKTCDFVFFAFLLLFSGKKRNAFLCLILNPVSVQTMITKRFLSFISSVTLFSTPPSPMIYRSFAVTWSAAMQIVYLIILDWRSFSHSFCSLTTRMNEL